jgi:hypothetical protein
MSDSFNNNHDRRRTIWSTSSSSFRTFYEINFQPPIHRPIRVHEDPVREQVGLRA